MKNEMPIFGSRMHVSAYAIIGPVTEKTCLYLNKTIIDRIGMAMTQFAPAIWRFPTEDGKGGEGATIIQSLTESFIAHDFWTEHNGSYLILASCKPYDPHDVISVIEDKNDLTTLNLVVREYKYFELDLL